MKVFRHLDITALLAVSFLAIIFVMAILAPWVTRFSYESQDMSRILLGPNKINWMGTDSLGRDLYSRIIYGARVSLVVGLITSLASLIMGIVYGSISGYLGGIYDSLMMRGLELLQAVPTLVLMILVTVTFDAMALIDDSHIRGVVGILLALSLVSWVTMARMVRGQVLQIREMPYVEAAKALGTRHVFIILRHILPNIWGPVIVMLTFQIPTNVMFESFLSFLGLGLQPPYSSWGVLANEGWRSLRTYPHLILFPGLMLFFTMSAFNFLGDNLRDLLDSRTTS